MLCTCGYLFYDCERDAHGDALRFMMLDVAKEEPDSEGDGRLCKLFRLLGQFSRPSSERKTDLPTAGLTAVAFASMFERVTPVVEAGLRIAVCRSSR